MLKDIDLKDIYLGTSQAFLAGVPGTLDPIPAPAECYEELAQIKELCDKEAAEKSSEEFAIRHNDVGYRVAILKSVAETVYVLRRFPKEVPPIETLSLHTAYVEALMQPNLKGLILISGPYGNGKTTTASSLIASRLDKFGGVGITIEDPPEMPLEGRHGEGVCYQTWVERGGFGEACRKAARWAPSMIFLGEIRDSDSAIEALRASINGRLVIATTHADKVANAIERLFSLACSGDKSSEDVASLLASGLLCAAHQTLEGDVTRRPKLEFLWLGDGSDEASGVRQNIRNRRFELIDNAIVMQNNLVLMRAHRFLSKSDVSGDRRQTPR